MQIDHDRFIKEGATYLSEVIVQSAEEPWNKLVQEKLSDAPPADLEGMKTLWMHGFCIGAELAVLILKELNPNNPQ